MGWQKPGTEASDEIFVFDEDPAMHDAWSRLFFQAGYRVTSFAVRSSFISATHSRKPAAIVLNTSLPSISEFDILDEVDAQHHASPIFVASARDDIPTIVEAIKRGAFGDRQVVPDAGI